MIGRSNPAYWDDFEFSELDYSPDFVFRDKDSKVGPLVWTLVWRKTRYGDQVEEKEVEDLMRRKWPWKLREQREGEDKEPFRELFCWYTSLGSKVELFQRSYDENGYPDSRSGEYLTNAKHRALSYFEEKDFVYFIRQGDTPSFSTAWRLQRFSATWYGSATSFWNSDRD